ncbi:glycoside hydrolase family 140 protein [Pedobacter sp. SYP-B3415]|uniref:glycoside hydrolase family 140 protein n=1 Tax=Pedobacter sp. SYP-B3415 TaxID=2496641 RepID=UPI001F0D2F4D|nr:glycoside hydrolase family 140 protein [Pedobacter sp. SYP-B3415]
MRYQSLYILAGLFGLCLFVACKQEKAAADPWLSVSENRRFLTTGDGKPFFWLGDTGWLLFRKLKREEANEYLDDRRKKGFNVIQVMVIHDLPQMNAYGDSAISRNDLSRPLLTKGSDPADSLQYDYWDHADYIIDLAAKKGLYMALVPVWGSNVKSGKVTAQQGAAFAEFLAKRYRNRWNIIWLNGGDIKGTDGMPVWNAIGENLRKHDAKHLITFHPRGRTTSSAWFHNAPWLDFNMFQSGHRRYDQDTSAKEKLHYGEDNWRYAAGDYAMTPVKPTIDGEPSYEDIPHGLHDTLEVRWKPADIRRYGYWSVFAGGFGYTYGHNSVMQFYRKGDKASYGPRATWQEALQARGATEMVYLKKLMLSRPVPERVPDQSLVSNIGKMKYDRVVATRGKTYAFIYSYTGADFQVNMGRIPGSRIKAAWFDPRTGREQDLGEIENIGVKTFNPPGTPAAGNDWVLILDSKI